MVPLWVMFEHTSSDFNKNRNLPLQQGDVKMNESSRGLNTFFLFQRINTQTRAVTHPSLERFPDGVSIAHVSEYPENDNAGLEPVHSSLREIEGRKGKRWRDPRRKIKQKEGVVFEQTHSGKQPASHDNAT